MFQNLSELNKNIYGGLIICIIFYLINNVLLYQIIHNKSFEISNYLNIDGFLLVYSVFLLLLLFLIYLKFCRYKVELIESEINIYKKILIVFFTLYCFTLLFDPFFEHNKADNFVFDYPIFFIKGYLINSLTTIIIMPILEELLFREIVLIPLTRKNIIFGITFSSFLFSFCHFYWFNIDFNKSNAFLFFQLFILAIILSFFRIKYGLLFSIIGHVFYNLIFHFFITDLSNLYILDYLDGGFYWVVYLISVFFIVYFIIENRKYIDLKTKLKGRNVH